LFCVLLAAVLVCDAVLPAQTARKLTVKDLPPSAFQLISIKVTGTQRYKPEDVIAACGLQVGRTVGEDDFKKIARELGETGAFSDVLYSFQYSMEGTNLELQVKDEEKFVPVRFDNVVWFSDQELRDKIQAHVPLFKGDLPVSGTLLDQVSETLQTLVFERNPQAHANYIREAKQGSGEEESSIRAIVFSVSGVRIVIRHAVFSGAEPSELPLLDSVAKKLTGQDYYRTALRAQEDKSFLPIYLEHGYLKASFTDAQAKVVQENPDETLVDVTFPVDRGEQYKLAAIEISGNKAFATAQLHSLLHLEPDRPANAVELETGIEAIKKLYGTKGYMAAAVQPTPEFDDAKATVTYRLEVREGEVYHMGDLEIVGPDSRTTGRLVDEWKLRDGDVYDSAYATTFLNQASKEIAPLGFWKISVHETLNEKDKTVDVTFRFDSKRE